MLAYARHPSLQARSGVGVGKRDGWLPGQSESKRSQDEDDREDAVGGDDEDADDGSTLDHHCTGSVFLFLCLSVSLSHSIYATRRAMDGRMDG